LYLLFRYFDKDLINYLLSSYFLLLGVFAVQQTFRSLFARITPGYFDKIGLLMEYSDGTKTPKVTIVDGISLVLALAIAVWYHYTKFWVANNIFGMSFAITGIELMSLGSFKIAAILLCGLFVYDVFWVFYTDVMVTVAKSVDHPIKLVFPKGGVFAKEHSMIGLGDLVLPGILIALLLRFDRSRGKGDNTYFNVCMISYTVGLITTVVVMHTFQAAQPALLYLVPACLGSTIILAIVRKEWSLLMSYTEEKTEDVVVVADTKNNVDVNNNNNSNVNNPDKKEQ